MPAIYDGGKCGSSANTAAWLSAVLQYSSPPSEFAVPVSRSGVAGADARSDAPQQGAGVLGFQEGQAGTDRDRPVGDSPFPNRLLATFYPMPRGTTTAGPGDLKLALNTSDRLRSGDCGLGFLRDEGGGRGGALSERGFAGELDRHAYRAGAVRDFCIVSQNQTSGLARTAPAALI
jgi:hypothetical protein